MSIFLDGISIFFEFSKAIIFFFVAVFGWGLFFVGRSRDIEISRRNRYLLSFGIGSAALGIVSYVLVILTYFYPFILRLGSFLILFFAFLVILREIWLEKNKFVYDSSVFFLVSVLFFLLMIRLVFLKYIILPPYSDSPIHYQIVYGFIHPDKNNFFRFSLGNIFNDYYHFGFHSISAWLVAISGIKIGDTISLLGQIFLVIASFSILFLTYILSKDTKGAVFAGLLSATAWQMPIFSVNWGKFPALSALAIFPSILAFYVLYLSKGIKSKTNFFLAFVLFGGIAILHTRIIIPVALAGGCYVLSKKIVDSELGIMKSIGYSFLFIISLRVLLLPLTYFYSELFILIIMLFFLPFAFQTYSRLAVGIFLFVFGLWFIWILPTLLHSNFRELLNKEFIEMILYIPLSLIGGIGFAGVAKKITLFRFAKWGIGSFLVVFAVFSFSRQNLIYPDECCNYFRRNDQYAFDFIEKKSSSKTLVLISADSASNQGSDAGIWLFPLIAQPTNRLPYNTNWDSMDNIEKICQLASEDVYIYVGGQRYSFDRDTLDAQDWYKLVFKAEETLIYQVDNCPE